MTNPRRYLTMPDTTWKRVDGLTEKLGLLDYGDLLRQFVADGLNRLEVEVLTTENKQLVNQKLRQRQSNMAEALRTLRRAWDDTDGESLAIDFDAAMAAIATIEKGLSD